MLERSADDMLYSALQLLRNKGRLHDTRNGKALSIEHPVILGIEDPLKRVVFSPVRQANPYFHVMETVWMFSGTKEVGWLKKFNSNIDSYAEPNGKINGAYGHRWRKHFDIDQLNWAMYRLKRDPSTRQVVINMYDPPTDYHSKWKDRPCNTHIYFRVVDDKLDMTVCNRSNDVIWGMCGANVVHMTYLQELVAAGAKLPVGRYHVMTNNLHIYEPHFHMLEEVPPPKYYYRNLFPHPLLQVSEHYQDLLTDCEVFNLNPGEGPYRTRWMNKVVVPMYEHYMCRLNGDKHTYDIFENEATDWRLAEVLWREWHDS